ncbi:MAG: RNA polymerase sigma factor SigF [Frankiaceae bacterium]|nr:RNA polymerase sigma factor SigF [Frankiaceae bacterium]MBV9870101.1 RNA polymerase sigma factor SigF [Frankiaceae bacterium]
MSPTQTDVNTSDAWQRLKNSPDDDPSRVTAREELVEAHLPLVHFLARRYERRGEPLDDLVQVGVIGLLKAIDRFDLDRGVAFSTFATPTIVGEIKRHFRDKTWMVRVPRPLQELRGKLVRTREALTHDLGRAPTVAELAEALDLTEDEVLEGLDAANAYSAWSLDAPTRDGDDSMSVAEARLGVAEDAYDLVEKRRSVAPLLDALPERERRIIFLRFFRDMSQAEIGEELGISQMHVSRLLSQTLRRLNTAVMSEVAFKAS